MTPKLLLCRNHFSDAFVAQIMTEAEGWHVIDSWQSRPAVSLSPMILCVISGSRKQQKTGCVKVRFVGGSSKGAFDVKIGELKQFLAQAVS